MATTSLAEALAQLTAQQQEMEAQYTAWMSVLQNTVDADRAKSAELTMQLQRAAQRSEGAAKRTRDLEGEMERLRGLVECDVLATRGGRDASETQRPLSAREKFWQRMATPQLLEQSEPPPSYEAADATATKRRGRGGVKSSAGAGRGARALMGKPSLAGASVAVSREFERMKAQLRRTRAALAEAEERRVRDAEDNVTLRAELAEMRRARAHEEALQENQNAGVLRRIHFLAEAKESATKVSALFIYRYISHESCSQFDSLPLTYLTSRRRSRSASATWPSSKRSCCRPRVSCKSRRARWGRSAKGAQRDRARPAPAAAAAAATVAAVAAAAARRAPVRRRGGEARPCPRPQRRSQRSSRRRRRRRGGASARAAHGAAWRASPARRARREAAEGRSLPHRRAAAAPNRTSPARAARSRPGAEATGTPRRVPVSPPTFAQRARSTQRRFRPRLLREVKVRFHTTHSLASRFSLLASRFSLLASLSHTLSRARALSLHPRVMLSQATLRSMSTWWEARA